LLYIDLGTTPLLDNITLQQCPPRAFPPIPANLNLDPQSPFQKPQHHRTILTSQIPSSPVVAPTLAPNLALYPQNPFERPQQHPVIQTAEDSQSPLVVLPVFSLQKMKQLNLSKNSPNPELVVSSQTLLRVRISQSQNTAHYLPTVNAKHQKQKVRIGLQPDDEDPLLYDFRTLILVTLLLNGTGIEKGRFNSPSERLDDSIGL
jgi:hypothetical protein